MGSVRRGASGPAGPAGPRPAACRSVVHLRAIAVVARLAGPAEVAIARLDRGHVAGPGRGVERPGGSLEAVQLGGEIPRLLPDFRLGAGLAQLGAGPLGEPAVGLEREARDRRRPR